MSDLDDRIAMLKEHIVEKTAEDHVRDAEECLRHGQHSAASLHLAMAESIRLGEELRAKA